VKINTKRTALLLLLSAALSLAVLAIGGATAAQSQPALTITGVQTNHSSVRVYYAPVAGATDYRIYDVANPTDVKYAGQAHYVPADNCPGFYCTHVFKTDAAGNVLYPLQVLDAPCCQTGPNAVQDVGATDIEWNGLTDSTPHTLVVQALDALGPVPAHNLYPWDCCDAHYAIVPPVGMLGSNKGSTVDGNSSTNGQGPNTNQPHVIAQSQPFVVQANKGLSPLGKVVGSSQSFLDTFEDAEGSSITRTALDMCTVDQYGTFGKAVYTMGAGTSKAWNILVNAADFDDTMPFVAGSHFMDMLFDGATGGKCNAPSDTTWSSLSLSPQRPLDLTSGGIVHLTMEVDAHVSFRRWVGFNLSPVNDGILNFNDTTGTGVSAGNHAVFAEWFTHKFTLTAFNGSTSPSVYTCDPSALWINGDFQENGRGLDDRTRLDLFVSRTHFAVFADNKLACQADIPSIGWFNQPLSAYYSHYLYHSNNDIGDLEGFELSGSTFSYPLNSYWFNDPQRGTSASVTSSHQSYPPGYGFPHSDERHWDNMGYEVIPSSATGAGDFSSLSSSVQLPAIQPPNFGGGGPTPTPTPPAATATPTPVKTATPTPTPVCKHPRINPRC
jgi:hypothetical protein